MLQFFQNIWAWICAHADEIAAFFSLSNLCVIFTTVMQLRRQKTALYDNTQSTCELRKLLKEHQQMRREYEELYAEFKAQRQELAEIKDAQNQCLIKLNCILEVQEKAYGMSLQGTKTLDAINGIIANGKYAETSSRKAIVEEVAEMREQLEKLTAATKAKEEKVKRIAGVAEAPTESKGVRYD